ncbi:MAG: hypothetical protein IMZ70_01920, partial [Candidatus Atribacteria bacterium]|nr:hypothetical protein [Candidatus Atribacteria bacterium]
MTDEEKRMAEIERLVAEQVEKQRTSPSTVGRKTFAPVPGQAVNPNVVPEKFKLQQDMQGNYWNRIQRTEGGPLVIERLSSEYSPADQKKITQLYQARSEAITDPENSPEEKQAFADKFDAMISIVPKMPPMMREPTPQQTFESSIVTDPATQQRGFFDPKSGKFNPLVDPKIAQEENDKFNERFQKNLDIIRKDNA